MKVMFWGLYCSLHFFCSCPWSLCCFTIWESLFYSILVQYLSLSLHTSLWYCKMPLNFLYWRWAAASIRCHTFLLPATHCSRPVCALGWTFQFLSTCIQPEQLSLPRSHHTGFCLKPVTALGGLIAKYSKGCLRNSFTEVEQLLRGRGTWLFDRQNTAQGCSKFIHPPWTLLLVVSVRRFPLCLVWWVIRGCSFNFQDTSNMSVSRSNPWYVRVMSTNFMLARPTTNMSNWSQCFVRGCNHDTLCYGFVWK